MLAAVPSDAPQRLELFCLVLVMLDRGSDKKIPQPLVEHFNNILAQAKILALDPNKISDRISPQAVQLANEFRCYVELKETFDNVSSVHDISPAIAHRALQSMRPGIAPTD